MRGGIDSLCHTLRGCAIQRKEARARYEQRAAPLPSPPHKWEGAGREGGALLAIQGEPRKGCSFADPPVFYVLAEDLDIPAF